jgi:hypothetical protein
MCLGTRKEEEMLVILTDYPPLRAPRMYNCSMTPSMVLITMIKNKLAASTKPIRYIACQALGEENCGRTWKHDFSHSQNFVSRLRVAKNALQVDANLEGLQKRRICHCTIYIQLVNNFLK